MPSHLLCSHLWGGGEAGQRSDPVPQLPRWLPVQQSVCVENHSSRRFRCWPLLSVVWGKIAFILIVNKMLKWPKLGECFPNRIFPYIGTLFELLTYFDYKCPAPGRWEDSTFTCFAHFIVVTSPADWASWQLRLRLRGGEGRRLGQQPAARTFLRLRETRRHQKQLQPAPAEVCVWQLGQQSWVCSQLF